MYDHAGNELRLMLEGEKPLSMFYYCKALSDRDILPIEDFSPYVESGMMRMEEFDVENETGTYCAAITYLLYARRGEEWRIPAMKVALTAQQDNLHSPDEGIDRVIGMLLGYPRKSIDQFVKEGILSKTYNKLKTFSADSQVDNHGKS